MSWRKTSNCAWSRSTGRKCRNHFVMFFLYCHFLFHFILHFNIKRPKQQDGRSCRIWCVSLHADGACSDINIQIDNTLLAICHWLSIFGPFEQFPFLNSWLLSDWLLLSVSSSGYFRVNAPAATASDDWPTERTFTRRMLQCPVLRHHV